jgi:hypothetical protein
MKWRRAWTQLDLDFYQFHICDWVDEYWPYSTSPTEYGLTDKPVLMGESPTDGLSSAGYAALLESWFGNGYAGALSWQYNRHRGQLGEVAAFAEQHPCPTQY